MDALENSKRIQERIPIMKTTTHPRTQRAINGLLLLALSFSLFFATAHRGAQANQTTTEGKNTTTTAVASSKSSPGASTSAQFAALEPLANATPQELGAVTTLLQGRIVVARASTPAPPKAPVVAPSKAWQNLLRHSNSFDEGILFQHEDGTTFATTSESEPIFNPASNTKLATSLAVLRKFGPDYKFTSEVRTNGTIDKTGELKGDLIITGGYMLFGDRQAHELASLLNKSKIKSISGDIYVSPDFSMNLASTGLTAGQQLLTILDPWYQKQHQGFNPRAHQAQIIVGGIVKLGSPQGQTTVLATHTSPPLRDMLKLMLAYSDNEMAERFGAMIGGPDALTSFVVHDLGVPESEVHFASTSGLLVNRISPRAMMTVLRTLRSEAQAHGLQLSALLDVAGVEKGTLSHRFQGAYGRTVIAKTGTLPETDMGVSALSGEVHTRRGTFLFVIFDKRGNVAVFRKRQDQLVQQFERDYGGPAPIAYTSYLDRIEQEDQWH
jgi:D-alanyl-D-alanine carboxypeptidase/D-alanyl-D-alanine-endopeptidase (penicillin-binding protein 4)